MFLAMHIETIISRHTLRMPIRQLVKVTEVFVFVSPFNSLIVHGSGVFTLDSCHLSLHLVSVFAFSHPVHWVSLVTGHSPSMQTPEPEQNTRLSLVTASSSRAPIGRWWLAPGWQKRITRCSIISLEEWFIHSSTDTAHSPLYTCYQSHPRDEMWCQPLH